MDIEKIIAELHESFQALVIERMKDGALPIRTDAPFAVDFSGQYSHAPIAVLWHFYQHGYLERASAVIELPKEANGVLIQHMPKGSGFRAGFEFCLKAVNEAGVNTK